MSVMVPIAMFGWIPLALGLFARLRAHRAAVAGFLLAWMFLPQSVYALPGLPDYSKVSAACLGILLGGMIFDFASFKAFRFSVVDIPIAALCIVPFFTSISNGLGAYDGISALLDKVLLWGIPWGIGRIYLGTAEQLREMVLAIFLAG